MFIFNPGADTAQVGDATHQDERAVATTAENTYSGTDTVAALLSEDRGVSRDCLHPKTRLPCGRGVGRGSVGRKERQWNDGTQSSILDQVTRGDGAKISSGKADAEAKINIALNIFAFVANAPQDKVWRTRYFCAGLASHLLQVVVTVRPSPSLQRGWTCPPKGTA